MMLRPQNLPESRHSNYPDPFKALVSGRSRKRLADAAKLKNFGVNLVTLEPGSWSSVRHWHSRQDELIYVLEGEVTLVTNSGEQTLNAGEAAGFPAGVADGHHLINHSNAIAVYLEVGDRTQEDCVTYPDDDLVAKKTEAGWIFTHKDGSFY